MGGSSLWLIPLADNPFTKTVQELISSTVPSNFATALENTGKGKVDFQPHVTLTSDIDPSKTYTTSGPQAWLDNLPIPTTFKKEFNEVPLDLDTVEADDPYFRKLTVSVLPNANLAELAASCRLYAGLANDQAQARDWADSSYAPHLSLMYADIPRKEVKAKVPLVEMQIAYAIGDIFACCGGTLCLGSELVLVDTSKEVKEWEVVASRRLDWVVWKGTRNLI